MQAIKWFNLLWKKSKILDYWRLFSPKPLFWFMSVFFMVFCYCCCCFFFGFLLLVTSYSMLWVDSARIVSFVSFACFVSSSSVLLLLLLSSFLIAFILLCRQQWLLHVPMCLSCDVCAALTHTHNTCMYLLRTILLARFLFFALLLLLSITIFIFLSFSFTLFYLFAFGLLFIIFVALVVVFCFFFLVLCWFLCRRSTLQHNKFGSNLA